MAPWALDEIEKGKVAYAVLFLTSDDAFYISGVNLPVDDAFRADLIRPPMPT